MLQNFENQVGKSVAIWNWIQLWNRPKDGENSPFFEPTWMNECRNHGAIPMVSWSPEASDGMPEFTNLQSILDGKEDAYLTAWGQASAAWGHPYFVRLMWEFTGSWTDNRPNDNPPFYGYGIYPYGNGNTPAIFVAAWQYIVDKVRAAGGTQISWVWCTAAVGDSVSTLQSLYPGDNYVDWVGTDIYLSTGQTFDQEARPELPNIRTVAPNKPVMLPETGYTGSNKASYWANLLTNILPKDYSYIKGIVVWEMPPDLTVVDSTTLPEFRQAIASSYYISNIYSSLNVSPINALSGINPTPHPTPTPAPKPTSSIFVDAVIIGVIVMMALVAASKYIPKFIFQKKVKNKKWKK